MRIRPERVTDYAEISTLHAYAFGNRGAEALIVALHRQRRAFDPDLSLVAEIDGRVIGHVLFSPHRMRLLGQTIPAVNLAPLAVHPDYQRQGIGGRLILEGHALASAKGYTVSLLLGSPSYYARFGYHPCAFGSAQVTVARNSCTQERLDTHHPTQEDVPQLHALWLYEEEMVDMALEPGPDLLDWLSPHPSIQALVYTRKSEVVGYTRIHGEEPTRPRVFLARDAGAARAMVATMAHQWRTVASGMEWVLPLHPCSTSASAFGHAKCSALATSMACSLGASPLHDYLASLEANQRLPGRVIWPVAFDLDEPAGHSPVCELDNNE